MPELRERRPPEFQQTVLAYSSLPFWRRGGFLGMAIMLGCSWLADVGLIAYSAQRINYVTSTTYGSIAEIVLLVSVSAFLYLLWLTAKYIFELSTQYLLQLTQTDVSLFVHHRLGERSMHAVMMLKNVDYIEFYTRRNREVLVLHGFDNKVIEIPLWAITGDPAPIVTSLRQRGLPIVAI